MFLSASGTPPPATQPVGVRQSSLAVPPHLFPLFRQPYPPNYISYNPYLPHIYMPQNAHQFLGHNGFPQPPSTGNVYIPPAAAAPGVKFPVAPPYKPGTNAGLTPLGILSGYASHGSSAVGFSPSAAMNPGSSAGPEELSASELKEKNLFSVVRQVGCNLFILMFLNMRYVSANQQNCNFFFLFILPNFSLHYEGLS